MTKDEYKSFERNVIKKIDVSKGVENELERIFKGAGGNQPSEAQKRYARRSLASETEAEKVEFKAKGKTYVKTGENKFQSVDKRDDVMYNPTNDTFFLLGDKGIVGKYEE